MWLMMPPAHSRGVTPGRQRSANPQAHAPMSATVVVVVVVVSGSFSGPAWVVTVSGSFSGPAWAVTVSGPWPSLADRTDCSSSGESWWTPLPPETIFAYVRVSLRP